MSTGGMADLSTTAEVFRRRGHGIIADLRSGQLSTKSVQHDADVDQPGTMRPKIETPALTTGPEPRSYQADDCER